MRPGEHDAPPSSLPAARAANTGTKTGATLFTRVLGSTRRPMAIGGGASSDYCLKNGKVPILSIEAIHQLNIFIFILAVRCGSQCSHNYSWYHTGNILKPLKDLILKIVYLLDIIRIV